MQGLGVRGSGFGETTMAESGFMRIWDLEVYRMLCDLHVQVSDVTKSWPRAERFELTSQVLRSSNSSPAQLAEKHSDRHVRNKIEGVNRSRGEAAETIHHLYMALLKRYIVQETFDALLAKYEQCIRMLNGLERSLEKHLPEPDRRFPEPRTPNPEP